ncbi:MAG: hypothetical protein JSV09_05825 [Thermoplasmata archaeon]|nr:MAG: hypothetical protein JSV09_05825 [Thermoplasmata archaeon]
MEVRCEICDAKMASQECIKCGKNVCSTCYWTQLGICRECGDSGSGKIA